jgi:YfiH family protein
VAAVRTAFTDRAEGDLAIDGDPAELARRRAEICPHPWTWLRQVHGSDVVVVGSPGEHAGDDADGAVTDVPGAVLSIQTADCVPLLLWSDGDVIGAAHAGWRGLYDGVVEAVVSQMEHLGATGLRAEIGPCISPAAYEFGRADLTRMALRFGPEVVAFTADGAPALDLRAAVRSVLAVLGVELVGDEDPPCTATDPRFFSWRARRDTGRQASVIWLEP